MREIVLFWPAFGLENGELGHLNDYAPAASMALAVLLVEKRCGEKIITG